MSLQPAYDQIYVEAFRRGLKPMDGEWSWWEATDGEAVHMECAFADGTVLKGYAPDGMVDVRAGIEAEKASRRRGLSIVDCSNKEA